MTGKVQLKVEILADRELPVGGNNYLSLENSLEFRPAIDRYVSRTRTLALGKLIFTLEYHTRELISLQCFVPSSRWRVEGTEPPPSPDGTGALAFRIQFGEEDFLYFNLRPTYHFHEPTSSLRIKFSDRGAVYVRVANCLQAGISGNGELTDLWMERLRFIP